MNRIVYFLLLSLVALPARSQVVAIQNDRRNVLYVGMENFLTVTVEQCPYDSIIVTCDNATVTKRSEKDHNHYIVTADSPGVAVIEVKKKTGKSYTVIDARRFKIENLPDPNPYYARKPGGAISVAEMNEDFAPFAKLTGFEHPPKYILDSFTVMVVREQKMVFIKRQAGGRKMDDAILSFFKTLRENDKLLFTDITCRISQDSRLMHLHALEFVIKNAIVTVNGEEKQ